MDDDEDEDDSILGNEPPVKSEWKLIKHLREFRRTHARECVNPANRQKYSRALQRDEELLSRSDGPPSTEELINLIESDKKKESIKARINACKFRNE